MVIGSATQIITDWFNTMITRINHSRQLLFLGTRWRGEKKNTIPFYGVTQESLGNLQQATSYYLVEAARHSFDFTMIWESYNVFSWVLILSTMLPPKASFRLTEDTRNWHIPFTAIYLDAASPTQKWPVFSSLVLFFSCYHNKQSSNAIHTFFQSNK